MKMIWKKIYVCGYELKDKLHAYNNRRMTQNPNNKKCFQKSKKNSLNLWNVAKLKYLSDKKNPYDVEKGLARTIVPLYMHTQLHVGADDDTNKLQ